MQIGIPRPIVRDYQVLDDFQRTDTLHGNWTSTAWLIAGGASCSGGNAFATNGVWTSTSWNVSTKSRPCEVSFVLPNTGDTLYYTIFTTLNSTPNGYTTSYIGDSINIQRVDAGALTSLVTANVSRVAGARYKFSLSSDGLLSFTRVSTGAVLLTASSTTYTGPFYLGFAASSTAQLQNFGGGGR